MATTSKFYICYYARVVWDGTKNEYKPNAIQTPVFQTKSEAMAMAWVAKYKRIHKALLEHAEIRVTYAKQMCCVSSDPWNLEPAEKKRDEAYDRLYSLCGVYAYYLEYNLPTR